MAWRSKKKEKDHPSDRGESSAIEAVIKPKRDYWEISVSRLKDNTSSEKVKTHLQSKGIEVKEVFVFPSKNKGTVSAKVRVDIAHKDRALDPANWPPGLRIASWIHKSKKQKHESNHGAAAKVGPVV